MAKRLQAIDQSDADYEQSLQQFVNQSPWDEQVMLDGLQSRIARQFGADGCLIIDDTGFPKQGGRSVGSLGNTRGRWGRSPAVRSL